MTDTMLDTITFTLQRDAEGQFLILIFRLNLSLRPTTCC